MGLTGALLPDEQSRTWHSPYTHKLGGNLSRETRKRAGKQSSARLAGSYRSIRLSCCLPKPCSASISSSEVRDCSRDCGLKGGKSSLQGSVAVSEVVCGVLALPSPPSKVSGWLWLGKGGRTANCCPGD